MQCKALLVHEFPKGRDEWMMPAIYEVLTAKHKPTECRYFYGPFSHYHAGTIHPTRLINLVYMWIGLPVILITLRPKKTFIRTAPVGLHLWAAIWLRLLRLHGVCWLMDYHPEIEIRALERRSWGRPFASILRKWDQFALKTYDQVIVLDSAMEMAVKCRYPDAKTIVFPTWPKSVPAAVCIDWQQLPEEGEPIKLLYAGHFGAGHELGRFVDLLQALAQRTSVQLWLVGLNRAGEAIIREACAGIAHLETKSLGRVPFEQLPEFARQKQIHYGLVFMKDSLKGLLSPSKFSGYLAAGLPLLYSGPTETNAFRVCSEFKGGVILPTSLANFDSDELCKRLLDLISYRNYLDGIGKAAGYYFAQTPEKLASLIFNE